MTKDQRKIVKYFILSLLLVLLNLSINFRGFSLGYIFSAACLIGSLLALFYYLFYRGTYQEQGKEILIKKTLTLYAILGGLFCLYAAYKIYITGNIGVFVSEAVIIALLFFLGYQRLKRQN